MKKLLLLFSLLFASPAWAVVAFDAFSKSSTGTGTLSWTHTPVGTPKAVIVSVPYWNSFADEVTSVTYGGQAMTQIAGCSPLLLDSTEDVSNHAFFLGASVPTGAQTVEVTVSGATTKIGYAVTLTAGDDTEVVDCKTVTGQNIEDPTVSLTLDGRTSFAMVSVASGVNDVVTTCGPFTGWTSRDETDVGLGGMMAYTFDTVGSTNVEAGFDCTSNRVALIAVAVSEEGDPGEPPPEPGVYGPDNEVCHTDGTLLTAGNWETTLEAATPGTKYRLPAGTLTPSGGEISITPGTSDAARVTVVTDNCAAVTINGRARMRGWTTLAGVIATVPDVASAGVGTIITTGTGNIIRNSDVRTVAGGTNNANVLVGGGSVNTLIEGNIIDAKGRQNGVHITNSGGTGSAAPARDTVVKRNKMWVSTGQEDAVSFFSGGPGGNTRWDGVNNSIEENWFTGGATENYIDIKGAAAPGSVVRVVRNLINGTGVASGCVLIHTDTAANSLVIVEGNYFLNCNQNRSLTLGGKFAVGQPNEANWSAIVRGNVFVQAANTNEAILDQFANSTIEKNTFFSGQLQLEDDIPDKQTVLRDNIFSGTDIDDNSGANDVDCDNNNLFNTTGGFNSTCANGEAQDPQFVSTGTNDFNSQQTGLVDQGTANNPFNGAARDIGPLEPCIPIDAEIGALANDIVVVNWSCNIFPPLSAANNGNFSLTVNAAACTMSAVNIAGQNQTRHTLDVAGDTDCVVTTGETVLLSSTYGAVEDSSCIGGPELCLNAKSKAFTDLAVTNNVDGTPSTHEFLQTHFAFYHIEGTQASPIPLLPSALAEDNAITVPPQAAYLLRIKIQCQTANCPPFNARLRYSKNDGAFTELMDTFSNGIKMYGLGGRTGVPAQDTATTELLTSDESTNVACIVNRVAASIPNLDLSQDSETECAFVVQHDNTVSIGDVYKFRLYDDTGQQVHNSVTAIVEPAVTIGPYVASIGS